VSVHGANRLGTNSLLDIVVFGRRGGAAMAAFVRDRSVPGLAPGFENAVVDTVAALLGGDGTRPRAPEASRRWPTSGPSCRRK